MTNKYILREFRFTPMKKLDSYIVVNDKNFYSSNSLTNMSKEIISQNKNIKPLLKKVIDNINKEKIIIGYFDKSIFSFLWKKFKNREGNVPGVIGLYDPNTEKVLIVLDNNVTITGKTIYNISNTIIHEMCHAIAHKYTNEFLSNTMNTYLLPYYLNVTVQTLRSAFSGKIEININDTKKLIVELQRHCDFGTEEDKTLNAGKLWNRYFKNIIRSEEPEIEDKLNKITAYLLFPYLQMNGTLKSDIENITMSDNVIRILNSSYKNIGVPNPNTSPCQEINSPSEIVAVANQEKLDSKLINLLKKF